MKNQRKGTYKAGCFVFSVLLMSACGGGGSDDAPTTVNPQGDSPSSSTSPNTSPPASQPDAGNATAMFDQVGVVFISSVTADGLQTTSASSEFSQLRTPVFSAVTSLNIRNSCAVGDGFVSTPTEESPEAEEPQSRSLSAGEVITLSSENGTFASLIKTLNDNIIEYLNDDIGISPRGLSLVVDIPGDEFPGVQNLALPVFDTNITNVASQLMSVRENNTIRWQVRDTSDFDVAGVFFFIIASDGVNSTNFRSIACYADDDGEFTIPADTISALGSGFEIIATVVSRASFNSIEVSSNAFIIYSEVDIDSLSSSPDFTALTGYATDLLKANHLQHLTQ